MYNRLWVWSYIWYTIYVLSYYYNCYNDFSLVKEKAALESSAELSFEAEGEDEFDSEMIQVNLSFGSAFIKHD